MPMQACTFVCVGERGPEEQEGEEIPCAALGPWTLAQCVTGTKRDPRSSLEQVLACDLQTFILHLASHPHVI